MTTSGADLTAAAAQPEFASAAADCVAELRRTEQQSDMAFMAAQQLEWEKRQAEISRQSEEARALKRQRKAHNERMAKQQVVHLAIASASAIGMLSVL